MNIFDKTKRCTGCAACVDACPTNALKLTMNKDGFYEPVVIDTCIHCEKCIKICPSITPLVQETNKQYFYGWSLDADMRSHSSSGGLFSVLAEKILSEGGIVFGARYSEDFKSVVLDCTENTSLQSLRTSKYVQSKADGVYKKIALYLNQGKKVLFVGAPCQVAGVRSFFGENQQNLLLVDFLCGGFPSVKCYEQYIDWIEKKYKSKVNSVNFRDKNKDGWTRSGIKIGLKNGKEYYSRVEYDPYYYYYGTHLMKNNACLGCQFRERRYADITIADFWGFRKLNIENDNKGISLIITYNQKGRDLLNSVRSVLNIQSLEEKYAMYAFEPNGKGEKELQQRREFLDEVANHDFIYVAKQRYYKNGKIGIIFRKFKRRIANIFKK